MRRRWLLDHYGDGATVECWLGCGRSLDILTLTVDRIIPRGSYRRDNILPACLDCNRGRSDTPLGCNAGGRPLSPAERAAIGLEDRAAAA